jgi:sugar lactone lactonase YvrE
MDSMKAKFPLIRSVAGVFLVLLLGASARQAVADLYVADSEAKAIYRYTPDGVQHTFASIPQPACLAFDLANNLYVGAYAHQTIYKIQPNGKKSVFVSGDLANNPVALAFDSAGSFYVSHGTIDTGIDKLNRNGRIIRILGNFDFGGLALDSAGNLYATEILNSNILKITPDGRSKELTDSFGYPGRLTFDADGNLYAIDTNNGLIDKIAPKGSKTLFAAVPHAIAFTFDHSGYLFVATSDNFEGSIVVVAPDGTQSTFATDLQVPIDIAVPNSL